MVKEIEDKGRKGLAISADVMDMKSIPKALDKVCEEMGHLDIMVNNAGGNLDRKMYSLPEISIEKSRKIYKITRPWQILDKFEISKDFFLNLSTICPYLFLILDKFKKYMKN